MNKIGIIDYGVGNLRSIQKAFEYSKIDAIISNDLKLLQTCDKLILPGVGAYAECKNKLDKFFGNNLIELLKEKSILGICVGMQLLFNYSLEFKRTNGLNLIDGFVDKLETIRLPIPNAGWNTVNINHENFLFKNISNDSFFYFTHSYKCNVTFDHQIIGLVEYEKNFCCAVNKDNLYGVQFHPEKSGKVGLELLKNFAFYC